MDNKRCEHIHDILSVERKLIESHITKHKWYTKIKDDNDAIIDFVHRYAWLMREVFCGAMCIHRDVCGVSDQFKKVFLEDISDGEIEKYIKMDYQDDDKDIIRIKLQVLKHDIKVHKWLNKIDNYEDAVRDFLDRFGWVIREMYKHSEENNGSEEK